MKYKKVLIIGAGSIGGFLCYKLSKLSEIEKIIIIDYDIVKERNLSNSIYKEDDVGKKKVNCLKEITNNNNKMEFLDCKFDEFDSNLDADNDLIIDCRDFIYNRKNIDIRLSIFGYNLIVDSRKRVDYLYNSEGNYILNLNKFQIQKLIDYFIDLLKEDNISSGEVKRIGFDEKHKIVYKDYKKDENLITDYSKISNIPDIRNLDIDRFDEIKVKLFISEKNTRTKKLDPKFCSRTDMINEITTCIPSFDRNNYILIIQENEISVIPETGAA